MEWCEVCLDECYDPVRAWAYTNGEWHLWSVCLRCAEGRSTESRPLSDSTAAAVLDPEKMRGLLDSERVRHGAWRRGSLLIEDRLPAELAASS